MKLYKLAFDALMCIDVCEKIALTQKLNKHPIKFKSKLLDMSLSPIFTKIANSQLDAFVARAKKIYD